MVFLNCVKYLKSLYVHSIRWDSIQNVNSFISFNLPVRRYAMLLIMSNALTSNFDGNLHFNLMAILMCIYVHHIEI